MTPQLKKNQMHANALATVLYKVYKDNYVCTYVHVGDARYMYNVLSTDRATEVHHIRDRHTDIDS